MLSLAVSWAVGLGAFVLLFHPVFTSGSRNSDGGAGRHVQRGKGQSGNGQRAVARAVVRTTVRQRFANVFSSFSLVDWSFFVLGAAFLASAVVQTLALTLP